LPIIPAATLPAVDTHAHVFVPGLALSEGRRYTPDYEARPDDYLALLRTHGLSHGVLVQPSFLGTDNAYLLRALRACPAVLRGVAVVAPDVGQDALTEMAAAGVVGIRLNLVGQPTPALRGRPWQGLLERVAALGWHVEVHLPAARLPEAMPGLLAAGCAIVVDHFGRPDPALGIADPGFAYLLRQADCGRVWVKLSGAYRNWPADEAADAGRAATRQLLRAYTPARLMWGSDWPHTEHRHVSYAPVRRWLDAWIEDPAERAAVLGDTPARLFGLGQPASPSPILPSSGPRTLSET
jgi:predicted TIM-barrel fold metal-dependent hydrolase